MTYRLQKQRFEDLCRPTIMVVDIKATKKRETCEP